MKHIYYGQVIELSDDAEYVAANSGGVVKVYCKPRPCAAGYFISSFTAIKSMSFPPDFDWRTSLRRVSELEKVEAQPND